METMLLGDSGHMEPYIGNQDPVHRNTDIAIENFAILARFRQLRPPYHLSRRLVFKKA